VFSYAIFLKLQKFGRKLVVNIGFPKPETLDFSGIIYPKISLLGAPSAIFLSPEK